jgi:RimJ/RimL family protein N-acetyltransferase
MARSSATSAASTSKANDTSATGSAASTGGQGHATRALTELVAEFRERPLYAHVAEHNTASLRVLAKCGFVVVGETQEAGDPVKEIILRLS